MILFVWQAYKCHKTNTNYQEHSFPVIKRIWPIGYATNTKYAYQDLHQTQQGEQQYYDQQLNDISISLHALCQSPGPAQCNNPER